MPRAWARVKSRPRTKLTRSQRPTSGTRARRAWRAAPSTAMPDISSSTVDSHRAGGRERASSPGRDWWLKRKTASPAAKNTDRETRTRTSPRRPVETGSGRGARAGGSVGSMGALYEGRPRCSRAGPARPAVRLPRAGAGSTFPPMDDPAASGPPPTLCIDATLPAAGWRLWGMSLVERHLREARRRGLDRAVICVTPETAAAASRFRPDLDRLHPQHRRLVEVAGPGEARRWVAEHVEGPVLLVEGDSVVDDRIFDHLLAAGPGCVVRGEGAVAAHLPSAGPLAEQGGDGPWEPEPGGPLRVSQAGDLDRYVPELRLTMPPFLIRLTDPRQLRPVDRLMFHRTFKGVIDVVARYGYYHLVRFLTRALSRTTVSPNLLTLLSVLGIWAAIPCFAAGRLGAGILCAWAGVLLDSVDGKLARLTVNLSDRMGGFEHAAAIPGLGLWFAALGWHLGDGRLLTPSPAALACWTLVAAFLLDKLCTGGFNALFGYELFDARPLDAAFHLVAARRNVHLLILTVGTGLGAAAPAYEVMAWAMAATLAVHALRFAWIAATGARERAPGG